MRDWLIRRGEGLIMGFSDVIRESRMLIPENVGETWIKKNGDEEEGNYRLL